MKTYNVVVKRTGLTISSHMTLADAQKKIFNLHQGYWTNKYKIEVSK